MKKLKNFCVDLLSYRSVRRSCALRHPFINPIRRRRNIMLSINLDDVMQVLTNVRSYLIAFGVVLALAIIVMVAVRKLPKAKRR